MDSLKELEGGELRERIRNTKKLILIDTLEDLGLTKKNRDEFVRYYYTVLDDMGIEEALVEFKKKK